ncbi:hypothetical protein RB597_003212 [Gaeumannomyces tritici]
MARQSSMNTTANGKLLAAPDYSILYERSNPEQNHRRCPVFLGADVTSDSSRTSHPRHPRSHNGLNMKHPTPSLFERLPTELLVHIASHIAAGPDATNLCAFRLLNKRAASAAHALFAETCFKDLVVMRQVSSLHMLDEISKSDFRDMVTRVALDVVMLPTVATDRGANSTIESDRQENVIRQDLDMHLLTATLLRFPNLHTLAVQYLGILREDPLICRCAPWGILASRSLRQITGLCPHDATTYRPSHPGPIHGTPGGGNPWTSFGPPLDSQETVRAHEEARICVQKLLVAAAAAGLRPKTFEILAGTLAQLGHEILQWPGEVMFQVMPMLKSIRKLRLSLRLVEGGQASFCDWLGYATGLRSLHLDMCSATDQYTGSLLYFVTPPRGMTQTPQLPGLPPVRMFPWIPLAELTLSRGSLDVNRLIACLRHFGPTLQHLELDRITLYHHRTAQPLGNPPASQGLLPRLLDAVEPVARGWASFRLSHIAHSGPRRPWPPPPPPPPPPPAGLLGLFPPPPAGLPGPFPPQGYVFIAPGGHYKTISYAGPHPAAALRDIRRGVVASSPWTPDPEARWEGADRWEGSWDPWARTCACERCASMVYIHVRPADPESYPVDMDLS